MIAVAAAPRETEREFLAAVIELAHLFGWRVHHVFEQTHYARRVGHGFPDLCMVRGNRIVFAELKVGRNKLSPAQAEWQEAFERVSDGTDRVDTYVWRPEDWDLIEQVLR